MQAALTFDVALKGRGSQSTMLRKLLPLGRRGFVRSEDRIIAINGQPASAFTIDQLGTLFSQDGRVLWLTVIHEADTRSIRLILRKRL